MELHRAAEAAEGYRGSLAEKLRYMKQAVIETPAVDRGLITEISELEKRLQKISTGLTGDVSLSKREFEAPTSIMARIGTIMNGVVSSTSAPTKTFMDSYDAAASQFEPLLKDLNQAGDAVKLLEQKLEQAGAPYTPGRAPVWKGK
jgi:hypothetical protein